MRFFSVQFPNLRVFSPKKDIEFVDGVYDTDDADEIKILKTAGFESTGVEDKDPEPPKKKAKR